MILQRYILKELVVTFLLGFLVLNLVCAVGLIFQMFRTYDNVGIDFVLNALPMAFSYMAPWALLIASTLSGTLVYGRLAGENEIDAMRSSGIHAARILAPAVLFSVFVLGCAFLTHHELASWGRYRQRTMKTEVGQFGLQNPPPGKQNLKLGKKAYLSYTNALNGVLVNPFVYLLEEGGRLHIVYHGTEGRIEFNEGRVRITIDNGSLLEYDLSVPAGATPVIKNQGPTGSTTSIPVEMEDPYSKPKSSSDMAGLELVSEWVRAEGKLKRELYTELHLRFAKSLGPFCMIFVAVPIGIFVRKGTRLAGLGIALPPLVAYLILLFLGESLANKELVAPEVGAYGPDLIVLAVASFLMVKVFRT